MLQSQEEGREEAERAAKQGLVEEKLLISGSQSPSHAEHSAEHTEKRAGLGHSCVPYLFLGQDMMVSGTDTAPRSTVNPRQPNRESNVIHCGGCFVKEGSGGAEGASNPALGHQGRLLQGAM